jgi:hypothetical protein
MMMRLLKSLLATSLLLLSGCVVYSINPISPPGNQAVDQAILGYWQYYENGKASDDYLVLEPHAQGVIGYMLEGRNKEIDIEHIVAHTSMVANKRILNVRLASDPHPNLYVFARYQVTPDTLGYSTLEVEAVRKDIEAGTIAGTTNNLVLLTADRKELQNYFTSTDHFENTVTEFHRTRMLPAAHQKALTAYKARQ